MDNRQHKISSSANQDQDFEFEIGSATPGSPFSDPSNHSPADHLFLNGRLLPHSFPIHHTRSRRTSSVGSKDSLVSSRSNSTSSRSSSCNTSARTSSSDNSDQRKVLLLYQNKVAGQISPTGARERPYQTNKPALNQLPFRSSQRWQFIKPAPVLSREVSRRKKVETVVQNESRSPKEEGKKRTSTGSSFGRRFFQSFMWACRECHAMAPSAKDDELRQEMKLQL